MNQAVAVARECGSDGDAMSMARSCNDAIMPKDLAAYDRMPLHRRSNQRRHRNLVQLSPMLLLLQLASLATRTYAQTDTDVVCSCSPKQFVFRLDLSASCPPLPPPFPPNDVFGAGVKDYTCTIGPEPIPTGTEVVTSEDTDVVIDEDEEEEGGTGRSLQNGVGKVYRSTALDFFPELGEIVIDQSEWSSENFSTSQVADVDVGDTVPVTIYSIQFLEVDQQFNVINQDSSYVRDIDFTNGDVFNYTSIQGQIPGVVPGGMNMVLRGVNAENEPIRNVFTITYTNDCGVQTFQDGDAIGWVVFVSTLATWLWSEHNLSLSLIYT